MSLRLGAGRLLLAAALLAASTAAVAQSPAEFFKGRTADEVFERIVAVIVSMRVTPPPRSAPAPRPPPRRTSGSAPA
jgi:hypothetical protein